MFQTTQYDWVRAGIQTARRVMRIGAVAPAPRHRGRRLQFDTLEDRRLLAVTPPTSPAIDIPDDGNVGAEVMVRVENTQGVTVDLNIQAVQRIPLGGTLNADVVHPKVFNVENPMMRPGPSSIKAFETPANHATNATPLARTGNSGGSTGTDDRLNVVVCFAFDPQLMVSNHLTADPPQPM